MGKISNTMNYYFSDSKRFADLFNAVFFQGKSVVKPEELSEGSEVCHQPEAEKPKTGRHGGRTERIHDVRKTLKTGGVLRILALENQELVDYAMPFRCMQYDTMEYGKQLDEIRRKHEREERLDTAAVPCAAISQRPRRTAQTVRERPGIPSSGQGHPGGDDSTIENADCVGEEGKYHE